jgi:VIT1/CCC1 family predicted Fe2+/Mn2+ transporter
VFPSDLLLGMAASLIVAALALFLIGWYKAKATVGRPTRSGLEMLVIGILAAVAGFVIAYLVGAGGV